MWDVQRPRAVLAAAPPEQHLAPLAHGTGVYTTGDVANGMAWTATSGMPGPKVPAQGRSPVAEPPIAARDVFPCPRRRTPLGKIVLGFFAHYP